MSATLNEQSALPGKIGFVSENLAVATVNADGKVTGVAAGKTQIQVTVGVVSTSVTIFDGGEGTAREMRRRLAEAGLLNPSKERGHVQFENSLSTEAELALCERLLNMEL